MSLPPTSIYYFRNFADSPFLSDHDMNEVEDDGEDDGSGNLFADLV